MRFREFCYFLCQVTEQSYARQTEAGILTNLPLQPRRPNHRARSTKMPPSQSYKRRCVACQHSPDDQTLPLQAGAGEDDVIHLPSGLDLLVCEHQEEESWHCSGYPAPEPGVLSSGLGLVGPWSVYCEWMIRSVSSAIPPQCGSTHNSPNRSVDASPRDNRTGWLGVKH